jgi:hypothetical protein
MAEKKETPANKNTFGVMKNLGLSAKEINAAVDRLKGVKTSEVGVPRPTTMPMTVPVSAPTVVPVPRGTGAALANSMNQLPGTITPQQLSDMKLSFIGMTPEEQNKVDTYLNYLKTMKGM